MTTDTTEQSRLDGVKQSVMLRSDMSRAQEKSQSKQDFLFASNSLGKSTIETARGQPTANAVSDEEEESKCYDTFECLLMSSQDRYITYNMSFEKESDKPGTEQVWRVVMRRKKSSKKDTESQAPNDSSSISYPLS